VCREVGEIEGAKGEVEFNFRLVEKQEKWL
jgi:hypothetical protein